MLTITAILNQYAWLYSNLLRPNRTFDLEITMDGGLNGLKVQEDGAIGAYVHGSEDWSDWEHDFNHFALPTDHPLLGPVHPGFLAGALTIKPVIDQFAGDRPVSYVGHSYGAGRAIILAALRVLEGKTVSRVVLFGSPRAGGVTLQRILSNVLIDTFRNADKDGHDLVTDVPFNLGDDAPYENIRPLTDCWHSPRPDDPWLFFKYHHLGHYCRAFGCGSPQALSLPI